MLDLICLVKELRKRPQLTIHERFVANTLMWVIMSYGRMGRSGEWAMLELSHADEQIRLGKPFMDCGEHKNPWTMGHGDTGANDLRAPRGRA